MEYQIKKTNYEVNSILPLEIVNINKETFPTSKIIFSQNNIIEQFDYSLLINSLSKEEEDKNKEFEIFLEEVITINEDFKQSEIKNELKEINIISKEIDFEDNLIEENNFEVDQSENESDEDEVEADENEQEEIEEDEEDAEEISEYDDIQEDDQDEDIKLNINNKSSKKREKHHITEEMLIRKTEKDIFNKEKSGKETYDSIDDFEKKILTNTNSSELWINYVAFILENINYESAKKTFEEQLRLLTLHY